MAEFSISEGSFNPDAAFADDTSVSELTAGLAPPAPKGPAPLPPVGFDETRNKMFVNGFEFDVDDHDSALRSKEALSGPLVPLPQNYRPVGSDEFGKYIARIQDPSIGQLVKKNFGIGVDNLQLLGGRGIQFLDPALPFDGEKVGQKIVDQQIEDLRFTQPYQRLFTDIDSAGGAVEWFIANLAQQGPNLVESALSAIAGALAGGAIGGNPFTALGGAFLALSGKTAVKRAAIAAAEKFARKEALTVSERKLLSEVASGAVAAELRTNAAKISPIVLGKEGLIKGSAEALKRGKLQARTGGGIIGAEISNLGIGVSDVFGEQKEAGTENRLKAFGLAIPYSLAETLPELLGLGFFIKGGRNLATGISKAGRGAKALKRAGRAAGTGSVAAFGEGATEAFQEALLLSQNPQVDAGSEEGILRLVNSFAAGAGVGGGLGVVGGAVRGRQALEGDNVNILNPTNAPVTANQPDQQELFPDDDLGTAPVLRDGQVQGDAFNVRGNENLGLDPEAAARTAAEEQVQAEAQGRFGASLESTLDIPPTVVGEASLDAARAETQRLQREAISLEEGVPADILDPNQGELFPDTAQGELDLPAPPPAAPAPIAPTGQPVAVDFPAPPPPPAGSFNQLVGDEAAIAGTQSALTAAQAPPPANTALAPGIAPLQQRFEQDAAVAAAPVQAELFPETDFGDQPVPAGFPTTLPAATFVNGEEALTVPVLNEETGETTSVAIPVRQLIEEAQQRFVALKTLERCLG